MIAVSQLLPVGTSDRESPSQEKRKKKIFSNEIAFRRNATERNDHHILQVIEREI
jgi:hypothetical protein